ncbi:MAG TPA: 1-phosphofructokinase family hexose kinase [Segeticoccus sp.]|uniref:1-phosphofructokinase family hexose kinase n=1 Tax=Segeticoccus sp. TaxID=2706531 RepID=UPI002D7E67F2|nr:1-phosphofructokinase family hexose kinase [Segeticoccus sp.]HET8598707.1 1-phosphofructokinase family hexose kinase [Segeticoccus sp.]
MILTVTLNTALDVTYAVDRLVPHGSHRVRAVRSRAGGKGINVARVLHALGRPVLALGFAGGASGEEIRAELATSAVPAELVALTQGRSRRTVTVVSREDGDATIFNEPGDPLPATDWEAFVDRYRTCVEAADVVVLSGSLPPAAPPESYAVLVALAAAHGTATVVDASGEPLTRALEQRPGVVKPNLQEARATTGLDDPVVAAERLRADGAGAVVVSCGAEGLAAVTPEGSWMALPPKRIAGNPTGAGDACVAALAAGIADGSPWPERLADAVAMSAAAVLTPVAGELDHTAYRRFRERAAVEHLPAASGRCP